MIDKAQASMDAGAPIALELISTVNDNMSSSHFHEFYELYFLDSGNRYHAIDDKIFLTTPGDFIFFPPLTMHHSFSNLGVPFSRIVIYFRPDMIASEEIRAALSDPFRIYRPAKEVLRELRRLVYGMLDEQDHPGDYHWEQMNSILNMVLILVL